MNIAPGLNDFRVVFLDSFFNPESCLLVDSLSVYREKKEKKKENGYNQIGVPLHGIILELS